MACPVDDQHTYHVSMYVWQGAPGFTPNSYRAEPCPISQGRLQNEQGEYIFSLLFNQDYATWISQGPIASRDREKLGESDRGVILLRRQLKEQMDIVADGGDPMNVFRDPAAAAAIHTPLERVKFGQKRAIAYVPSEEGVSADAALIDEVVRSWITVPDYVNASDTSKR